MFISSAVFAFCLVGHFRNTKCWSDKYLNRGEEAPAMGPNFAVIITSKIFQKTSIDLTPVFYSDICLLNLLGYWVHRKYRISSTSTIPPFFWHHICMILTRILLRSTENVKNVVINWQIFSFWMFSQVGRGKTVCWCCLVLVPWKLSRVVLWQKSGLAVFGCNFNDWCPRISWGLRECKGKVPIRL